jgi:hypothetical protein
VTQTYALVQTTLDTPSVEALERAFRQGGALTAADAPMVAAGAFGILAHGLSEGCALNTAAFLEGEGIHVEVVADRSLPRLPDAVFFASWQERADGIDFFDASGRPTGQSWHDLRVIAAAPEDDDLRLELVFGSAMRMWTRAARLRPLPGPPPSPESGPGEAITGIIRAFRLRAPRAVLNRGATALAGGWSDTARSRALDYPHTGALFEEILWLLWRTRI